MFAVFLSVPSKLTIYLYLTMANQDILSLSDFILPFGDKVRSRD